LLEEIEIQKSFHRTSINKKKIYFFNLFISIQISLLIDDEEFRSRKFLNSTSYKKVHKECLQCLVCDHFDTLKSECNELIIKEDLDGI